MSASSSIEWTDATWNPVRGCTRVSEGCRNCYAEVMAARFSEPGLWGHGFATMKGRDHRWTGKVALIESQLALPLSWKKPRRIFVNSTSDLFHEGLPDEAIDRVFAVMALAPQHTFQVLTKRPERMRAWFAERWQPSPAQRFEWSGGDAIDLPAETEGEDRQDQVLEACEEFMRAFNLADTENDAHWTENEQPKCKQFAWPLPNVWLGTSVEDQATADERRGPLCDLAAQGWTTFVSYEPALDFVDWTKWGFLDWLISGGESGPEARPSHPDWHRQARDFCAARDIAYFFKQWGEWAEYDSLRHGPSTDWRTLIEGRWVEGGANQDCVARVGKKAAGRLLDGVEHNGFPGAQKREAA